MFSSPGPFPAVTPAQSLSSGFQFNLPQQQPQLQSAALPFSFGVTGQNTLNTAPPSPSPIFNFLSTTTPQTSFTFGANLPSNGNNQNISTPFSTTVSSYGTGGRDEILAPFSFRRSTGLSQTTNQNPIQTTIKAESGAFSTSNSFFSGTQPARLSPASNQTASASSTGNSDDEKSELKIAHEIYCEDQLVGFTITPSKIEDFCRQIANFKSCSYSGTSDNEMLQLVSSISQYCLENNKSLTPTSQCGLFLFDDVMPKKSKSIKSCQKSRPKSFPNSSYGCSMESQRQTNPEWFKRRRQSERESSQFIFRPKILTFLDSNQKSSIPSVFSSHTNESSGLEKVPSNLLKKTFPPVSQDFLKSFTSIPTGNLPCLLSTIVKKSDKKPLPPLNYDDYLKKYHEEKTNIMDSLYWDNSKNNQKVHADSTVDVLMKPKIKIDSSTELLSSIKTELVQQSLCRFQEHKSVERLESGSSSSDIEVVEGVEPCTSKMVKSNEGYSNVCHQNGRQPTVPDHYSMTKYCAEEDKDEDFIEDNFAVQPRSKFLSMRPPNARTCRINLTRKFYYCRPSLHTLDSMVDSLGHCFVSDFVVGHDNFGHVTFHGVVDVAGLNLDQIIDFKLKGFNLYPDEHEDQLVVPGQGLKRPATVTLFSVWPMDKERTHFITDLEYLHRTNYKDTLKRSCDRMKATFVSYRADLGHWTFNINESCPKN